MPKTIRLTEAQLLTVATATKVLALMGNDLIVALQGVGKGLPPGNPALGVDKLAEKLDEIRLGRRPGPDGIYDLTIFDPTKGE